MASLGENVLKTEEGGRHFKDGIFNVIFVYEIIVLSFTFIEMHSHEFN